MYVPPAFRIGDEEALEFLRARGFGTFIIAAENQVPVAVHIPLLAERGPDGRVRIEFHVARANGIHSLIGEGRKALLICQGPDAYISPDWYGVPNQVPTWTYVSVHVTGTATLLPESSYLDHTDRLSAAFEQRLLPKKPWTSAKMDEARRAAMLRAIVGIALDVESIEASRKLVQHKDETAQRGAIAGLRGRGDANSLAIAAMMEEAVLKKFGG